jgi:hypothetical protein
LQWESEFNLWSSDVNVQVLSGGAADARVEVVEKAARGLIDVLLINFDVLNSEAVCSTTLLIVTQFLVTTEHLHKSHGHYVT